MFAPEKEECDIWGASSWITATAASISLHFKWPHWAMSVFNRGNSVLPQLNNTLDDWEPFHQTANAIRYHASSSVLLMQNAVGISLHGIGRTFSSDILFKSVVSIKARSPYIWQRQAVDIVCLLCDRREFEDRYYACSSSTISLLKSWSHSHLFSHCSSFWWNFYLTFFLIITDYRWLLIKNMAIPSPLIESHEMRISTELELWA